MCKSCNNNKNKDRRVEERTLTINLSRFATLGTFGLNQFLCLRHNALGRWQRCSLLNLALCALFKFEAQFIALFGHLFRFFGKLALSIQILGSLSQLRKLSFVGCLVLFLSWCVVSLSGSNRR